MKKYKSIFKESKYDKWSLRYTDKKGNKVDDYFDRDVFASYEDAEEYAKKRSKSGNIISIGEPE